MTKSKHASVIEKEIEEKTIEIHALRIELVQAKKRLHLKCSACKQKSKVGDITAVLCHSEEDGGYCIGSTYHERELEFICPKCDIQNRLVPQKMMDSLRSSFKNRIDEFPHDGNKRKKVNYNSKI